MQWFKGFFGRLRRVWHALVGEREVRELEDEPDLPLPPLDPDEDFVAELPGDVQMPAPTSQPHRPSLFTAPTLVVSDEDREEGEMGQLVQRGEEPPLADDTGIFQLPVEPRVRTTRPIARLPTSPPGVRTPERVPAPDDEPTRSENAIKARAYQVRISAYTDGKRPIPLEQVKVDGTMFGGMTMAGKVDVDAFDLPGEAWMGAVTEEEMVFGKLGELKPVVAEGDIPKVIFQAKAAEGGVLVYRTLLAAGSTTAYVFDQRREDLAGDTRVLVRPGQTITLSNKIIVTIEVLFPN